MVNNSEVLDKAFSALGDGTRREMVRMLMNAGAMRVSDLAKPFDMSLPGVSKHIGILEQAELVSRRKSGREVFVDLNPAPLIEVKDWLTFHEQFWRERFEALDKLFKSDLS